MLPALDRVLLGRQAECVPAHGMQHVKAAHPFVASNNVRRGITLWMSDVQPCPTWIGKHVEDVKFRLRGIEIFLAGIRRMKKLPLLPNGLPLWFEPVEWIWFAALAAHRIRIKNPGIHERKLKFYSSVPGFQILFQGDSASRGDPQSA